MESMLIRLTVDPCHVMITPMPERMIALVGDGDAIHAVFGPEMDLKRRYVAQVCDSRRVLPGAHLEVVQGKDIEAEAHVAIVDEKCRVWAVTGPVDDEEALATAKALVEHPAFIEAVEIARSGNMVLARPDPAS